MLLAGNVPQEEVAEQNREAQIHDDLSKESNQLRTSAIPLPLKPGTCLMKMNANVL